MDNHTKGKWEIEVSNEAGKEYKINTTEKRKGGGPASNGNSWICSIWTPKTGGKYAGGHRKRSLGDYVEAKANAHLIAAAPELLQVCELGDLLESKYFESEDDTEFQAMLAVFNLQVKQVIAKARGE